MKQVDLTSKGHEKALYLKLIVETSDMTSKGLAMADVLKQNEETSRHDFENTWKGAHRQTN